jgi:hypothetical protein
LRAAAILRAHGPLPSLPADSHPPARVLPHEHVQHARRVLPRHANGIVNSGGEGAAAVARCAARARAQKRLHHARRQHATGHAAAQIHHHQATVGQQRNGNGPVKPRRAHVQASAAVTRRAVASQRRDDTRDEVHRPQTMVVAVADHQPPAPNRQALRQIQPRRYSGASIPAAACRAGAVHPRLHQTCRARREGRRAERVRERRHSPQARCLHAPVFRLCSRTR